MEFEQSKMSPIVLSTTTYFLVVATVVACIVTIFDYKRSRARKSVEKLVHYNTEVATLPEPPGPKPWPILGSLHLLGQYEIPYMAFADLAQQYNSPVIKLRMGSVPCVVVNGLENIKEVLIVKGQLFDSRPNFKRYHLLFCGDKENCKIFIQLFLFFFFRIFSFNFTPYLRVAKSFFFHGKKQNVEAIFSRLVIK